MSDYSTAYQVTCVPGPKSAAAMTRGPGGSPVLVVYLDPVNMTIHCQPSLAGAHELAAFLRELAHEATRFAAEIDPSHLPATEGPRHRLTDRPVDWSGSGELR